MRDWLQRILRLAPQQQLKEIESREPSLEERLERIVGRLGYYRTRPPSDLEELMDDLAHVLNILDKIITTLENIGGAERAKDLRRRLRNNATRAENALRKLREAS